MKLLSKNLIFLISICFLLIHCESKNNQEATIKVALRSVGHKLLLQSKDSTSLVLPVIKLDENNYKLSFQKKLSIKPDSLINSVVKNLKNAAILNNFIVEVKNCKDNEVAYSFKIKDNKEENILPCRGRTLPLDCYIIHIAFIQKTKRNNTIFWLFPILIIALYYFYKRINSKKTSDKTNFITIGKYSFYENQNQLRINKSVIKLTKKECELIAILSKNKNKVVKREIIEKEIWEDNGVVVGRSLDAFISKIRKKFEHDVNINIINIHGVGYKLKIK